MSSQNFENTPKNYISDDEKKHPNSTECSKKETACAEKIKKNDDSDSSERVNRFLDGAGDEEVKQRANDVLDIIEKEEKEKSEEKEVKERAIALAEEIEESEKAEMEEFKKEEEARVWGSLSAVNKKPSLMQRLREARELENQRQEAETRLLGKKREQENPQEEQKRTGIFGRGDEKDNKPAILVVFNAELVIVNVYVKETKLVLGEDEERNPSFCTLNWFGHTVNLQKDIEEGIIQDNHLISNDVDDRSEGDAEVERRGNDEDEESENFKEWVAQRALKHYPSVDELMARNIEVRNERCLRNSRRSREAQLLGLEKISEEMLKSFGPDYTMVKKIAQGNQNIVVMDIGRDTTNGSTLHIGSEKVLINFMRPGFEASISVEYEKRTVNGDGEEITEIRKRTFKVGDDGTSSGYYRDGDDTLIEIY